MAKDETIEWMGTKIPKYGLLDFATFKKRSKKFNIPLFNNFFLYFEDGWTGDIYRKNPVFLKFQQEQPELLNKVKETLKKSYDLKAKPEWIDKVAPVLYEAYKIMKNYKIGGSPVSNYPDLFA